jgi:hypothetical protein
MFPQTVTNDKGTGKMKHVSSNLTCKTFCAKADGRRLKELSPSRRFLSVIKFRKTLSE